ncbi:hypothetical protein E2542_SST04877 [Spatholobus suberectus]|nr:hypothetical protein E2542_SST04877 [Spatholobus suberectus]
MNNLYYRNFGLYLMESLVNLANPVLEKLMNATIEQSRYICCFTSIAEDFEKEKKNVEGKVEVAKRKGQFNNAPKTGVLTYENLLQVHDSEVNDVIGQEMTMALENIQLSDMTCLFVGPSNYFTLQNITVLIIEECEKMKELLTEQLIGKIMLDEPTTTTLRKRYFLTQGIIDVVRNQKHRGRGTSIMLGHIAAQAQALHCQRGLEPTHPVLRQEVQRATERADAVTTSLDEANRRCAHLEQEMRLLQEQLQMVLDRQSRMASTSTSQVHPHYAEDLDDPPLDEVGSPARQCRHH